MGGEGVLRRRVARPVIGRASNNEFDGGPGRRGMTTQPLEGRWSLAGAVVGGIVAAPAYFVCCRWTQGVLSDEAVAHNLVHSPRDADRFVAFAAGVAVCGLIVGAVAGARASPAKAAGIGA